MKVLLFFTAAAASGVLVGTTQPNYHQQRYDRVWSFIADTRTAVYNRCDSLSVAVEAMSGPRDVPAVLDAYERLRGAWKAIEPLAEYSDPQQVSWFINGAPLPRLDPKSQYVEVLEPSGLQVIDELLHAPDEDVLASQQHLQTLVGSLRSSLTDLFSVLVNSRWTSRMQLEACRSGLIRITSLGLTAFDRPASDPRPSDNVVPLQTIGFVLWGFRQQLEATNAKYLASRADSLLSLGIRMIRSANSDDDLDKAELIRASLDPLYAVVVDIQMALQIEFADEALAITPPLDARSRSMFANNTLDPYTWAGVSRKSVTDSMIELGRTLFFDPVLSSNGERACASCHLPELAFTDGRVKSMAFDRQGTVRRNAPTLINAVLAKRFFLDLRGERLSEVVEHVINDEREFNFNVLSVVRRLESSPEYRARFTTVFAQWGESAITPTNVNIALAAYLGTLVNLNSPVDRYLRGEAVTLNPSVRRGFNLFMGRAACGTCHFAPTFAGYVPPAFMESESEVLGIPTAPDTANAILDPDPGRYGGALRDGAEIFRHSFKTPTIRNVKLTAPYMHNGAFPSLRDVVKFYDLGGGSGIGAIAAHQTLASDRLDFTDKDYDDLIAFMEALTDTTGFARMPAHLPSVPGMSDHREIGGEY